MYSTLIAHCHKYIDPTQKDLDIFTSKLSEIKVPKRTLISEPGTKNKLQYFVVKGCIKAFFLDDKGNKHILQFGVENWWVADYDAFYNDVPSKLYIETVENTTLLTLSYEDTVKLFEEAPIYERYIRILLTGAFISHRKRILSSLEKNTKDRYLEFCKSYPNIENRVPNYHIANYLGVSAEGLSRIRKQIKS